MAAWPSFSVYRGAAFALGPKVNTGASRTYAVDLYADLGLSAIALVKNAAGTVGHYACPDTVQLLSDRSPRTRWSPRPYRTARTARRSRTGGSHHARRG